MDLSKHIKVAEDCAERSEYFKALQFEKLATAFQEASISLKEMVELIQKVEKIPSTEEGVNE